VRDHCLTVFDETLVAHDSIASGAVLCLVKILLLFRPRTHDLIRTFILLLELDP
jgi:hypothetical protein